MAHPAGKSHLTQGRTAPIARFEADRCRGYARIAVAIVLHDPGPRSRRRYPLDLQSRACCDANPSAGRAGERWGAGLRRVDGRAEFLEPLAPAALRALRSTSLRSCRPSVAASTPPAAGEAGPAMPGPGIPRAGPAYGTGPDSATAEVAVASAPQRTHHDRGASLPLLASSPLFLRRRGVRAWRFVQPRCRGEGAFGSVPRAGLVAARVRLPEPSARTKGVRQGCPVALGTAG